MDNSLTSGLSKSELLVKAAADDAHPNSSSSLLSREAFVLGSGLTEGLGKGVNRSLGDLNEFGKGLVTEPVSTIGSFVQHHWSEAAVGAALAFVAPRKWANTLIAAASMR